MDIGFMGVTIYYIYLCLYWDSLTHLANLYSFSRAKFQQRFLRFLITVCYLADFEQVKRVGKILSSLGSLFCIFGGGRPCFRL